MFKLAAGNRTQYLAAAADHGHDLAEFDALISACAPALEPWFYDVGREQPGMTFTMLGYGRFRYRPGKDADDLIDWPVIGLAVQKNYASSYLSVTRGGRPVLDFYRDRLNCTRGGRNNFSFASWHQLDHGVLTELINDVETIFLADPDNPVRYKRG